MNKDELKNLTDEQKEKIVEQVNDEALNEEAPEEGNTSIFNMGDIDESASEGTAQAQYEKSVSINSQSLYTLDQLLSKGSNSGMYISRKNLIKLMFATLKLPEEGAVLKFGGTQDQRAACEFAYAQMQLAANTRAFILGVDAMRQQRRALKAQEEESKEQDSAKENNDE